MRARFLKFCCASGALASLLAVGAPARAAVHWSLSAQGAPGAPLTESSLTVSDASFPPGTSAPGISTSLWESEEAANPGEVVVTKLHIGLSYFPSAGAALKQIALRFSADAPGTSITPGVHDFVAGDGNREGVIASVGGPYCSTPVTAWVGRYTVHEARFVTGGVEKLHIDFDIRCAPGLAAVTGTFQYEDTAMASTQTFTRTGLVWLDRDRDGIRDAEDELLTGARVSLYTVSEFPVRRIDIPVRDDGRYVLRRLAEPHNIDVDVPTGLEPTLANRGGDETRDSDFISGALNAAAAGPITIYPSASPNAQNFDFGLIDRRGNIEGRAWIDSDADGLRDPGEPPLAGVLLFSYDDVGGVTGSAVTGADGRYSIAVREGTHRVTIDDTFPIPGDPLRHLRITARDAGADDFDSDFDPSTGSASPLAVPGNSAVVSGPDVGYIDQRARVTGQVFADRNRNGIRDPDEGPLSGPFIVSLYDGDVIVAETGVDANGRYNVNTAAGIYRVRIRANSQLPFVSVPQNAGNDDTLDSDIDPVSGFSAPFSLSGNNQLVAGPDAGFDPPRYGSVKGRVWQDLDGDGVREAGEPVPGFVIIHLYRNGNLWFQDGLGQVTVVNANGEYEFPEIAAGDGYTVKVVPLLLDVLPLPSPRAVNGANDSDFLPATGETLPFALREGDVVRRDLGFITEQSTLPIADFFPLVPGARWTMRSPATGAVNTLTVQSAPSSVNSAPTRVIADSNGDLEHYSVDANGLRLHRQIGPVDGGTGDLVFIPPLPLAAASVPAAGTTTFGSVTGFATFRQASGAVTAASIPISYSTSSSPLTMRPTSLGVLPVVALTLDISYQEPGTGAPVNDQLRLYLARGIGPVEILDPDEGRLTLDAASVDHDGDGLSFLVDNCPQVSNANQLDTDADGAGDACDLDFDEDEVLNALDNCPLHANPTQSNVDGDRFGDACDPDDDNDGMSDGWEADNGFDPLLAADGGTDSDGDGYANRIEALEGTNPRDGASRPIINGARKSLLLGLGGASSGPARLIDTARMQATTGTVESGVLALDTGNAELASYVGTANQTLHPAWCNIDDDPAEELVIGLGSGSRGWMAVRDDVSTGYAHLRWIKGGDRPGYHAANGATYPACGDLDGDGRDEIVVGYGAGGGGWLFVLEDATRNFAPSTQGDANGPWIRRNLPSLDAAHGSTYPTVGNFDGDALDEIAVGGGPGNQGRLFLFDDGVRRFQPIPIGGASSLQLTGAGAYVSADGSVQPAHCDLNADGRDELVFATGAGVQVRDASNGQPVAFGLRSDGWLESPLSAGFTARRATCANFAGNAEAEIVTVDAAGQGALYGGASLNLQRLGTLRLRDGARGWQSEWPAIGGGYPLDSDNDGVFDSADAFPSDPAESRDSDGDGTGDNADTDDDGDGMSDADEIAVGLDPRDAAGRHGADGDFDGDGFSNLFELQNGMNPTDGADAAGDSDSDGWSNWIEYQEGTALDDAASTPTITPTRNALVIGRAGGTAAQRLLLVDTARMSNALGGTVGLTDLTADGSNAELTAYLASSAVERRPVWCQLDGDSAEELVIGHGRGSRGWLEVRDDANTGFAHLRWVKAADRPTYHAANGETYPACGDVDGDGRDEIVIGYGPGGGGWLYLLDDLQANFAPLNLGDGNTAWLQRNWSAYNATNGAVYPAVGNFDADPLDEIAVGGGTGNEGWVRFYDDAVRRFQNIGVGAWVQVSGAGNYNTVNGTVWPVSCDLDADGRSELLLSTDAGVQVISTTTGLPVTYTSHAAGWLETPVASPPLRTRRLACGQLLGDAQREVVTVGTDGTASLHAGPAQRMRFVQTLQLRDGARSWSDEWPAIGGGYPVDSDGDGVFDGADAFPADPAESRDSDGDGLGDNADPDDDNDGMSDVFELGVGLDPRSAAGVDGPDGDLDDDGLLNVDEIARGTDLANADSDGDGIDDGYEVANGLDPLVDDAALDSDGDGASNLLEYRGGGDPQDPTSLPLSGRLTAIGLGAGSQGAVEIAGSNRRVTVVPNYAANPELAAYAPERRQARPTWCDVDGDGRRELVIGFGPGSGSWLEIRDDATTGFAHLRWLRAGNWQSYNAANGETLPACGNLDGDAGEELVVGYGRGGDGWMMVLDDAAANHARYATPTGNGWLQRNFASYNAQHGETRPTLGNLDDDAQDEIAVGGATGNGGRVYVYDDALHGFALRGPAVGFAQSNWTSYNALDGATWPAICPYDTQGRTALVLGLGSGSAGFLQTLDPRAAYAPFPAGGTSNWRQIADAVYAARRGEVRPGCALRGHPSQLTLALSFGLGGGGATEFTDGAPAVLRPAGTVGTTDAWPAVDGDFIAAPAPICHCSQLVLLPPQSQLSLP